MKFGVTGEWSLSCFLFLCSCLSSNYYWTRGLNLVCPHLLSLLLGSVLPDRWRSSRMRAEESSGHRAHTANWEPQEDSQMKEESTGWCRVWLHVDDIQCWWWQKWLGSVTSFQRGSFLILQIRYVPWHTCNLRKKIDFFLNLPWEAMLYSCVRRKKTHGFSFINGINSIKVHQQGPTVE